jgi:hypothetical protein
MVSIGWGNVHNLLAGPDLEHPGNLSKSRVHHFPVHQVKLLSKKDISIMEPWSRQLLMNPEPDSFPFIQCGLVVAKEDT